MVVSGRVFLWLMAALAAAVVSIFFSQQRALDPLQNALITLTSPAQTTLRQTADAVNDFFTGLSGDGSLRSQMQELRGENERLTVELARLREELRARQSLKELALVTESRPEERFLVANIIAKSPGGLRETLAINRGHKQGVAEGMVVVAQGGALVGTVSRVLDDIAWVTLINDPNSRVNAQVQESGARGVVSGRADGSLLLELIPQVSAVKPGDVVVTSGLGGTFPKALLIGRVVGVRGEPQDPFKRASVEPAVAVGDLEKVLVLTSFMPPKLEQP